MIAEFMTGVGFVFVVFAIGEYFAWRIRRDFRNGKITKGK